MAQSKRRTVTILTAVVATLLLLSLAWLIYQGTSEQAKLQEQEAAQLKHQQRINARLQEMRDSSGELRMMLSNSVATAVQTKNLDRRQVGMLRDSLELFEGKLRIYERDLDKLETDAHESLDDARLEDTLSSIQEARDYLGRLRASRAQFEAALSNAFDRPLDRAIRDAYKRIEEALKALEKDQKKSKS